MMATTELPRLEPLARAHAAHAAHAAQPADATRSDDAARPAVDPARPADSTVSPLARGTRLAVEASLRRHRLVTTRSR
jgi:hypothetical protein